MGPETSVRLAQRACGAFNRRLDVTGVLTPKDASVIKCIEEDYGNLGFIATLKAEAAGLWRGLVAEHEYLEPHLPGWLKRSYF